MDKLARVMMTALVMLQSVMVCSQNVDTGHLYAVLVNGGRNRLTNHERYWNDCSFLYRTLRQTFHIPKRNITVLMSDGGKPYEDMLRTDGRGFVSSPEDLDGDGKGDVNFPATRQMLNSVLITLSQQLTTADHLFLFVIDHGGTTDHLSDSFIWLWEDERMEDYALRSMLSLIEAGSINIVMGQCYAGGFMDEMMRDGRIMTAACRGDEQSWVSPDRPYDEFVYHWTCAVNGADETGLPVDADADGNGEVSMAEAFEYARSHDRVNETPQYASWPEELGEQWTFRNACSGTLGIKEVRVEGEKEERSVWTLSGLRRAETSHGGVYILRQNGKIKKMVK